MAKRFSRALERLLDSASVGVSATFSGQHTRRSARHYAAPNLASETFGRL
ncbi:MAG: hypothetical protein AVDCRST_MAG42-1181 [uncultured Chthoniobacterales bacterium]|uniref:Uncharacterized protein n=1 Tax=uncultured Chthoniobacterales bacterium TaxID=1836801 RepID=A0A6J4HVA0_9BACT|nr:MAG: hypothetical protein AVDCRST_MAG42-1181 [uncultured Chthoniobacterales bacterium]